MSDNDAPLLDVRNLTTEFASERRGLRRVVRAADGVSLKVGRGGSLGLVGESGSGKSVTALSIVRLVPPPGRVTGGVVRFDGLDLVTANEAELRRIRGARIGFVFQEPARALNPVFTVGDQIAESLEAHGLTTGRAARARAVELLDSVRIGDPARCARDYPHQLSGGMRQRVLIAAAIACRPSILIADEPTTALDVTIQAEILDLLVAMRQQYNLALLLVTHDLGVVARLTDRVAVMYAGRIVEEGPARDVLTSPAHPYTKGLLASLPGSSPGQSLRAIPGVAPDLSDLPPGCAFAPRCPDRFSACDERRPDALPVSPVHAARCFLHGGVA